MRRTVFLLILILSIPALSQANIILKEAPGLPGFVGESFRLESGTIWAAADRSGLSVQDLARWVLPYANDNTFAAGQELYPGARRDLPDDMISMMSFVWANLTGCVDVVREVRVFSRQLRDRRQTDQAAGRQAGNPKARWKFFVACRLGDNLELAARFHTHGRGLREGQLAWQLSAADVFPESMGVTTVYRNGTLRIEPDEVVLNRRAEAKMVVNF